MPLMSLQMTRVSSQWLSLLLHTAQPWYHGNLRLVQPLPTRKVIGSLMQRVPIVRLSNDSPPSFWGVQGFPVLEIHSRKSQGHRNKISEQFRNGRGLIMFTSDVSARGMDYPDVSAVIQVRHTTCVKRDPFDDVKPFFVRSRRPRVAVKELMLGRTPYRIQDTGGTSREASIRPNPVPGVIYAEVRGLIRRFALLYSCTINNPIGPVLPLKLSTLYE